MQLFVEIFDNLTPGRGLHRVWESICEGDRTQLVARWIDPETEKSQSHESRDAKKDDGPRNRGLVSDCTSANARPCVRRRRTPVGMAA